MISNWNALKYLTIVFFEGGCTSNYGDRCLHYYRVMCHKYHQFMMYYFPYFVSVLFPFVSVACTCSSNKLKNSVCVLSIFLLLQSWCKRACLHSWWCIDLDVTNWIEIVYSYLVIESHMCSTYVFRLINIVEYCYKQWNNFSIKNWKLI